MLLNQIVSLLVGCRWWGCQLGVVHQVVGRRGCRLPEGPLRQSGSS